MAKALDLTKLSLDELNALSKDVQKAIADYNVRRRNEALAAAREAAKSHGFDLNELLGAAKAKGKSMQPPKYADPEKPELTWSGRGPRPAWIKKALAQGKSMDDFAI